jgi:hypothetical protein
MPYTRPFAPVLELGNTELIGINEQVDQNDYCAAVSVTLGAEPVSGEILSFCFYSLESGSGAVQTPAGWLYILDTNPVIASGDTAIGAANRPTILGRVQVEAGDWEADANGATAYIVDTPVAFHDLTVLWFTFKLTSATSLNDAAGDDEYLQFNAWYRRDS